MPRYNLPSIQYNGDNQRISAAVEELNHMSNLINSRADAGSFNIINRIIANYESRIISIMEAFLREELNDVIEENREILCALLNSCSIIRIDCQNPRPPEVEVEFEKIINILNPNAQRGDTVRLTANQLKAFILTICIINSIKYGLRAATVTTIASAISACFAPVQTAAYAPVVIKGVTAEEAIRGAADGYDMVMKSVKGL